jgi:hypothetical protein
MVASEAAASKCKEKCKKPEKPTLVGDSNKTHPFICHCTHFATTFYPFTSTLGRGSSIRQRSPSSKYIYKAGTRCP